MREREEVEEICRQVERWVRIGFEDNTNRRQGHGPTSADVSHSALLRLLLSGEEPYPTPPPRMFSYPAYDFAAGERLRCFDVSAWSGLWSSDSHEQLDFPDVRAGHFVLLNQGFWEVEERDGDDFVLRHIDDDWRGRLTPANETVGAHPLWHFQRVER